MWNLIKCKEEEEEEGGIEERKGKEEEEGLDFISFGKKESKKNR